jgi:hypothetical protein
MLGWPESVTFEMRHGQLHTTGQRKISELLGGKRRHESVLAYESYLQPLLGIDDVLILKFMLLYVLSIWVRYRPALWRDVNEGDLSDFPALVSNFLLVAERTIPNEVLDRLYDRDFLFAGFAYLS